ncbi:MAG: class I SAM-dependent methyltransferase [Enhydrobacter sp.]
MTGIQRAFRSVLDGTVVRLARYIDARVHPVREHHDEVFDIVSRRAAETSADYIEAHLDHAQLFPTREQVWDYALSQVTLDGLNAEFGVFEGHSINHIAAELGDKTIYGFDSFEGLKEDWSGTWYRAGHFTLGGKMPEVRPNVQLNKGWFDATVPPFLAAHPGKPFAFVHLDADTYESTTLVLSLLADRIVPGTVLVFDDYLGFPNWQHGEYMAWQQFVTNRRLKYRYLAFGNTPVAVIVL